MLRRVLLPSLCLAAISACQAADAEVEALLKKMRQAYASVKTAKVSGKGSIKGPADATITQQLSFMAPNSLRANVSVQQTAATLNLLIVTDGKDLHIAMKDGPSRTGKYHLDAIGNALAANLEILSFFDWKRQLSTEAGGNMKDSTLKVSKDSWRGKSWTVLEETVPKDDIFVRYYIDPKTNLIWRTVQTRLKSKTHIGEWELTKLELNPKLQSSSFNPPPGGTKV